MSDVDHHQVRAIGEKLRAARTQRRISLRSLAHKAEISASMLSQIETGKAFPSVRSLFSIAAALDVPVDYFFPDRADSFAAPEGIGEQDANDLTASEMRQARVDRTADRPPVGGLPRPQAPIAVIHTEDRPSIELRGGVTWARLTGSAEPDVEFIEITYAPGATSGINMSHHTGREFGLVFEGELVLELEFETYTLAAGDSIIFDSTTPHRLCNNGPVPMRALWVVLSRA